MSGGRRAAGVGGPAVVPGSLAARVFEEECRAYPHAIGLLLEGRVRVRRGPGGTDRAEIANA